MICAHCRHQPQQCTCTRTSRQVPSVPAINTNVHQQNPVQQHYSAARADPRSAQPSSAYPSNSPPHGFATFANPNYSPSPGNGVFSPLQTNQDYYWMDSTLSGDGQRRTSNTSTMSSHMNPYHPNNAERGQPFAVPPMYGGHPPPSGHHGTPQHNTPPVAYNSGYNNMPAPINNYGGTQPNGLGGYRVGGPPLNYQQPGSAGSAPTPRSIDPETPPSGFEHPNAHQLPGGAEHEAPESPASGSHSHPHEPNNYYCPCYHCVMWRANLQTHPTAEEE